MTKTRTLMLATTAALTLGAGAALAQEPDAQFLRPSQIPVPTHQWAPGMSATNTPARNTYSVRTGHWSVDPALAGGGDGGAVN